MNIIVGFSKRKGFLSWLIRKAENTPYSHVYVRYWNPYIQEMLILHAAGTMVHCSTVELFLKHKNSVIKEYVIPVESEQLKQVIKFSMRQSGKPYGMTQLIGMAWSRILKQLFGKTHKNPFGDKERTMVCSEFVAHVLNLVGYNIDMKRAEIDGPKWIEGYLT